MTALIFSYEEDSVFVAMDTLVHSYLINSDIKQGFPDKFLYKSKLYFLEDDKVIICGVENAGLKEDWHEFVLNEVDDRSILNLNKIATNKFQELDEKYMGSTIYQFGYDKESNKFLGFVYRSENKYISERLNFGFGTRPKVEDYKVKSIINKNGMNFTQVLIETMREQMRMDNIKDTEDRVFIGGEIEIVAMKKDGYARDSYELTK